MLYVCSSLKKYSEFRQKFPNALDLSKVPSSELANECDSVTNHHSKCSIFIGYLEPGWMISASDQTRIRKALRKFEVAMVCFFPESIPFSWKNEINTFYIDKTHGSSNTIDDGSPIQDQSNL